MTGSVVGPLSPAKGNIHTVGFPLSSSVNRANPNQGDVQFMAIEVERGRYSFRSGRSKDLGEGRAGESWRSMVKRKGKKAELEGCSRSQHSESDGMDDV